MISMAKKVGRPSKINKFIEAAKEVLFSDSVMLFTDEELVDEINERLEEKDRISQRTFERWKASDFEEDGKTGKDFVGLIKKALRKQKENLLNKYSNDDRAWQRWAWIIERKFSEWNLKHISENLNVEVPVKSEEVDYSNLDAETLRKLIKGIRPKED